MKLLLAALLQTNGIRFLMSSDVIDFYFNINFKPCYFLFSFALNIYLFLFIIIYF